MLENYPWLEPVLIGAVIVFILDLIGNLISFSNRVLNALATAIVFGRMSDRSGRRKVYVISATVVMALAAVILEALLGTDAEEPETGAYRLRIRTTLVERGRDLVHRLDSAP